VRVDPERLLEPLLDPAEAIRHPLVDALLIVREIDVASSLPGRLDLERCLHGGRGERGVREQLLVIRDIVRRS
jgi:hypothetical protein